MQRILVCVMLLSLAACAAYVVKADDKSDGNPTTGSSTRQSPRKTLSVTVSAQVTAAPTEMRAVTTSAADEQAIRALGEAVARAYQKHDAQGFAAAFTAEGEFVDDTESLFHGRSVIEKEFTAFFKANPEATIGLSIDVIRPIAPGIIKAQGTTSFQLKPTSPPISGRCSLVCTKDADRWLIASLREIEVPTPLSHHDQVKQVEWMVGDWINEGQRAEIHFTCRWDQSGNYLLREFTIQAGSQKVISGTQRIGYDPVSGQLKVWTFDSDGGYSDGYLKHEQNAWVLHTSGVTDEGHMASGTEIFSLVDPHRIAWDCVDRMIAGRRIADTGKITVVRKPPSPSTAAVQSASRPSPAN